MLIRLRLICLGHALSMLSRLIFIVMNGPINLDVKLLGNG